MKTIQKQLPLPGSTTIEALTRPFGEFARLESSGGILLICCTLAAMLWANSPWSHGYFELWHTKLTVGFAQATLSKEIHFWINDGLMAIFFLLVGLEIKREVLIGELASLQKAAFRSPPRSAACFSRPAAIFSLTRAVPARRDGDSDGDRYRVRARGARPPRRPGADTAQSVPRRAGHRR